MPLANYHTHTYRCGHAYGTDREYVESAIAAGFRVLGFSDHAPMPFADGHESNFRVPLALADDYVSSLLALRREYAADIEILIGFECEYYPDTFGRFLDFTADYPLDYLILGQHFVTGEPGIPSFAPNGDPAILRLYFDTVREGVETGRFLYVAHPDNMPFTGDDETYASIVLPFLRRMKELDIPMEINRLGLQTGRSYPSERFFSLCAEVGNSVVIGVDAHDPESLRNAGAYADCVAFAQRFGLTPISQFSNFPMSQLENRQTGKWRIE